MNTVIVHSIDDYLFLLPNIQVIATQVATYAIMLQKLVFRTFSESFGIGMQQPMLLSVSTQVLHHQSGRRRKLHVTTSLQLPALECTLGEIMGDEEARNFEMEGITLSKQQRNKIGGDSIYRFVFGPPTALLVILLSRQRFLLGATNGNFAHRRNSPHCAHTPGTYKETCCLWLIDLLNATYNKLLIYICILATRLLLLNPKEHGLDVAVAMLISLDGKDITLFFVCVCMCVFDRLWV